VQAARGADEDTEGGFTHGGAGPEQHHRWEPRARAYDLVDELHLLLYPLILGGGKRLFPDGVHTGFTLKKATPYPSGVVGLHYERSAAA
jgi:hypothetical protein